MFEGAPHPWQARVWQRLAAQIETGRLPHALLFEGIPGSARHAFIDALAARLLCSHPVNGQACGVCQSCHLFAAGTHPDSLRLGPEEKGRRIAIEGVREVCRRCQTHIVMGDYRVVVVRDAHLLTTAAANALLKTLEAPPLGTIFCLLTDDAHKLLATVRSRCQRVALPPSAAVACEQDNEAIADLPLAGLVDRQLARLHQMGRSMERAVFHPAFWQFYDKLTTLKGWEQRGHSMNEALWRTWILSQEGLDE